MSWPAVRGAPGAALNDAIGGYRLQRVRVATYRGCVYCGRERNHSCRADSIGHSCSFFRVTAEIEHETHTTRQKHDPPEQQRKQTCLPANASKAFALCFNSSGRFFVFLKRFRCYEEYRFEAFRWFFFTCHACPQYFTHGGKTQLFHTWDISYRSYRTYR